MDKLKNVTAIPYLDSEAVDLLQLISFYIGNEKFCIDILKVREVIRLVEITRVPKTPDFIDGVINLRGQVIPIIDVRSRFGMDRKKHDKNTRIIVFEVKTKIVGFLVDRVSEVLRVPESLIGPPPAIVAGIESDYITAVGLVENQLLILLDLEKILSYEETRLVEVG